MNITFDWNCLLDLECELKKSEAGDLRRLVAAHDVGHLNISVPGIQAAERLQNRTFAEDFQIFQQRISQLSTRGFEILKPLFHLDMAYWDWVILAGDETTNLERKIHEVLFPHMQFDWPERAKAYGIDPQTATDEGHKEWLKWRNRRCDTLALWCHIFYKKDVFVTQDRNFHIPTKKMHLEKLGAKRISYPHEVNV